MSFNKLWTCQDKLGKHISYLPMGQFSGVKYIRIRNAYTGVMYNYERKNLTYSCLFLLRPTRAASVAYE
jgi:hypothetical protein